MLAAVEGFSPTICFPSATAPLKSRALSLLVQSAASLEALPSLSPPLDSFFCGGGFGVLVASFSCGAHDESSDCASEFAESNSATSLASDRHLSFCPDVLAA